MKKLNLGAGMKIDDIAREMQDKTNAIKAQLRAFGREFWESGDANKIAQKNEELGKMIAELAELQQSITAVIEKGGN
ncbi:hypothetical protein [Megasphaera stantonii]|uniref:hypothetical protein n=1 Tax=Megasphaera stantonii TaxID=2144175 RepID=UPI00195C4DE7|nr:hypothetical protein [Megasphaera stantonii]MBM6731874.1 hypothetical protein [Megasphaera stantonii]